MKKLWLLALLIPFESGAAVNCDEPVGTFYTIPKFDVYMNSTVIDIESDNNFNNDVRYDYGVWFAQYDWEGKTKLKLKRNGGNTTINFTVANFGSVGYWAKAWTETNWNEANPGITSPQATCDISLNTYYMDPLWANSEITKFAAIIKHEIGHCLGLAHHGISTEIMVVSACIVNHGPSCSVSQDACYSVNNEIY